MRGQLSHSAKLQDLADIDGDTDTAEYLWQRDDGVWFEKIIRVNRP